MKLGELDRAKEILEDAKNCRITFMSTVKEEDIEEFSNCLESGKEFSYKLGAFTDEVQEEKPQKLIYADDEDDFKRPHKKSAGFDDCCPAVCNKNAGNGRGLKARYFGIAATRGRK